MLVCEFARGAMIKWGRHAILIRSWLRRGSCRAVAAVAGFTFAATALAPNNSLADENGISFWIPGFFGSLAATPQQPGWSLTATTFTDVQAAANRCGPRNRSGNSPASSIFSANVHANVDLQMFIPTYVFATPFLGGQASASLLGMYGVNNTSLNATLTGTLGPIPFTKTISLEQTTSGVGDLIPLFAVRWNAGVNNYMTYLTGDIPIGDYNSSNLANIGLGHGALDGGVGYTYFDPKTGHEFSAATGLTGNFTNPSTSYTSGVDWHLDWGASQFVTKQLQLGLVGYFYDQLTPDHGCAPQLCPFESRVIGIGPQIK